MRAKRARRRAGAVRRDGSRLRPRTRRARRRQARRGRPRRPSRDSVRTVSTLASHAGSGRPRRSCVGSPLWMNGAPRTRREQDLCRKKLGRPELADRPAMPEETPPRVVTGGSSPGSHLSTPETRRVTPEARISPDLSTPFEPTGCAPTSWPALSAAGLSVAHTARFLPLLFDKSRGPRTGARHNMTRPQGRSQIANRNP